MRHKNKSIEPDFRYRDGYTYNNKNSEKSLIGEMQNKIEEQKSEIRNLKRIIYKKDKEIVLSADSEKIYNNISNLINNIWSKTSSIELDELYQKQPQLFNDPNLFIKVYAALSRNKFKQPVRRKIMQYFDNCFSSPEIIDKAYKIINELGEDLLLSHEI